MRDETRQKPHLNNKRVWLPNNSHRSKRNKKGNIMKNLFAYDFTNNTIVASKTTLKKAGNPTTPEYKALMKMIAGQPTFRVVEKVIKDNGRKNTHNGLTLEVMKTHIEKQENKDILMAEFEEAIKMGKSKYPLAKKWFLNQFPNFKISEGKKAVGDAKIAKVKANAKAKIVLVKTPADKKAS